MAKVFYPATSIYAKTPIKNNYLDIWSARGVISSAGDEILLIPNNFHQRPDLASFQFYNTTKYWYIFALRNKDLLKDPIYDFKAGLEIFVPPLSSLVSY